MADDFSIKPGSYTPPATWTKPAPAAPAGAPVPVPGAPGYQPPQDAAKVGPTDFSAGSDLEDLDGPAPASFQQELAKLPPREMLQKLYGDILGRQPSPQELKDGLNNWRTMIEVDKQSPDGARQEFMKMFLNSPEFQVKQGREQLNMHYGVPVMLPGAGAPMVWGSQTTGPGGAKFYHGQDLPYGPVDFKHGMNFMMEYLCNGTSGNPLMNQMRGFGKDDVSRTGLGSPAFEKLTKLGAELYHLGWGGTDHYGFDGSRRDPNSPEVRANPDPDLFINMDSIRSPQDMAAYLGTRIQQLDHLTSQMDPQLDSPTAFQTVQQMRAMLVAGQTFSRQIAGGATTATIVEPMPGAEAGWYAGGDPSQPLPGDLANWQQETYNQPLAAYQEALQDPHSYVANARRYFLS